MIQQFRSDKKAMTLIELILAIVLLNVIILTGISMELGIRRIFSSTDFEAQLLSEAVPIMMMVAKDINRAVGDIFVPAVDNASYNDTVGAKVTYYIRKDANVNGLADGGDIFAEYRYSLLTDRLDYRPNSSHGGYTRLSDRVANFYISAPVKGVCNILLTLRKNAALAANYTNPQVTLNSSAQYRGYSYN